MVERYAPDQRLPFSAERDRLRARAYHRFALSPRDAEDLLAERGVTVSYETIRDWVARFAEYATVFESWGIHMRDLTA